MALQWVAGQISDDSSMNPNGSDTLLRESQIVSRKNTFQNALRSTPQGTFCFAMRDSASFRLPSSSWRTARAAAASASPRAYSAVTPSSTLSL